MNFLHVINTERADAFGDPVNEHSLVFTNGPRVERPVYGQRIVALEDRTLDGNTLPGVDDFVAEIEVQYLRRNWKRAQLQKLRFRWLCRTMDDWVPRKLRSTLLAVVVEWMLEVLRVMFVCGGNETPVQHFPNDFLITTINVKRRRKIGRSRRVAGVACVLPAVYVLHGIDVQSAEAFHL